MNAPLWKTLNDLPERVRAEAIALLNQQLADALDLHLQAKQAHWNVKGPNFIALHELFDEVEEELEEHADDIAERAVALGGTALGTARSAAETSQPAGIPAADLRRRASMSPRCRRRWRASARSTRAAIDAAAALGDADTADLFTGVSRGVDKLLWKVEAHSHA